jgi:hypothetical protein
VHLLGFVQNNELISFISAKTQKFSKLSPSILTHLPNHDIFQNEQEAQVTVHGRSLKQQPGYSRNTILKPTPQNRTSVAIFSDIISK